MGMQGSGQATTDVELTARCGTIVEAKRAAGRTMTNDELIDAAAAVLKPYKSADGRLFGDVGAALVSEGGKLHTGVCVDTA
jgi:hypothetical protein